MRLQPTSLLLLVLAALGGLLGCGPEAEDTTAVDVDDLLARLQMAQDEELEVVAEKVGQLAQEDPAVLERLVEMMRTDEPHAGMITLEFSLVDPAAIPNHVARGRAMQAIVETMAHRLRIHGHAGGTFDTHEDENRIELLVPKPRFRAEVDAETRATLDVEYGHMLLRHLTAPGRVELLVVVPPPKEGVEPASAWTASPAAYNAFVETQAALLDAAVAEGAVYAPGEPGFVLVAVPPAPGETEHGYLVVQRAAGDGGHFDRDDFGLREIVFHEGNRLGLEMKIKADRVAAFKAWTAANQGREVVLVVNGVAGTPVRILEPLEGTAAIPVGAADDRSAQARRAAVMRALATSPYAHAVRGRRVTVVGPSTVTPAAMALVASGNAGAARMGALRAEGGAIGARAGRILELIGRRRTTGGERFVPGNK
ncbi:MAG: hypothetical protein P1V36_03235 [Planctomycetota bacterium]|nr:hypothetical protein [Planctomycetota bacterium]